MILSLRAEPESEDEHGFGDKSTGDTDATGTTVSANINVTNIEAIANNEAYNHTHNSHCSISSLILSDDNCATGRECMHACADVRADVCRAAVREPCITDICSAIGF